MAPPSTVLIPPAQLSNRRRRSGGVNRWFRDVIGQMKEHVRNSGSNIGENAIISRGHQYEQQSSPFYCEHECHAVPTVSQMLLEHRRDVMMRLLKQPSAIRDASPATRQQTGIPNSDNISAEYIKLASPAKDDGENVSQTYNKPTSMITSVVESLCESAFKTAEEFCKSVSLNSTDADEKLCQVPRIQNERHYAHEIEAKPEGKDIDRIEQELDAYGKCVDKITHIITTLDEFLPKNVSSHQPTLETIISQERTLYKNPVAKTVISRPSVKSEVNVTSKSLLSKAQQTSRFSLHHTDANICKHCDYSSAKSTNAVSYIKLLLALATNVIVLSLTCSGYGFRVMKSFADRFVERRLVDYLRVCILEEEFSYVRMLWMTPLVVLLALCYAGLYVLVHINTFLLSTAPHQLTNNFVRPIQ